MREMTKLTVIMVLLTPLLLTPVVYASSNTYAQPMFQVDWTTKVLLIHAPDNPSWPKSYLRLAIDDWNQAQTWFLAIYEPNHQDAKHTLQLAESDQAGQVTVRYISDYGQRWWGLTSHDGEDVSIVLSRFASDPTADRDLRNVIEHELGHVLGLGDNCLASDLMLGFCLPNPVVTESYPSTLNLYAVFVQANSANAYSSGDSLTLPSNIPYEYWQSNMPLPDLQGSTLTLPLLLAAITLLVFNFRREKS